MLSLLFSTVAPIFIIIALGWLARWNALAEESWVDILTGYVYNFALPALIIQSFASLVWSADSLFAIVSVTCFMLFVSALVFAGLSLMVNDKNVRTSLFLIATISNTVYMGFPIMAGFFGQPTVGTVAAVGVVQLIISILVSLLVMEYWLDDDVCVGKCLTYVEHNPLFISLAVGLIASVVPSVFTLPIIAKPIAMLAGTASPVALFALGAFMYGKFSREHIGAVALASVFKVLLMPLLAFLFLRALGITGENLTATVISAGMPVAITAFVFAQRSRVKGVLVGSAVIVSTVAAFITVPVMLFALSLLK